MKENDEIQGNAGLLDDPEAYVKRVCTDSRFGGKLVLSGLFSVGGMALFGLAAGSFSGWQIAFIDALKASVVMLGSYLLCLPTMYVFASMSGCRAEFARLATVALVVLAVLGCILAALAPVLWLFAMSTESARGFELLVFTLAIVAWMLGLRTIGAVKKSGVVNGRGGLVAWYVIFMIVALQMITVMRPMLSSEWRSHCGNAQGKCFFMRHFAESCLGQ